MSLLIVCILVFILPRIEVVVHYQRTYSWFLNIFLEFFLNFLILIVTHLFSFRFWWSAEMRRDISYVQTWKLHALPFELTLFPVFLLFQGKPSLHSVEAWVLMPARWWSPLPPRPPCLTRSGTSIASMRTTRSISGRGTCPLTSDRTSTWWSRGRGSPRYCRALWVPLMGREKERVL